MGISLKELIFSTVAVLVAWGLIECFFPEIHGFVKVTLLLLYGDGILIKIRLQRLERLKDRGHDEG